MAISVTALAPEHIDRCMALWKAASMAHEPDMERRVLNLLELSPGLSQVAVRDGYVIGCVLCSYNGFSGYVFRLAVREDHRTMGIGTRLMDECERRLREIGAAKVVLACEEPVVGFYSKRGYLKACSSFMMKGFV